MGRSTAGNDLHGQSLHRPRLRVRLPARTPPSCTIESSGGFIGGRREQFQVSILDRLVRPRRDTDSRTLHRHEVPGLGILTRCQSRVRGILVGHAFDGDVRSVEEFEAEVTRPGVPCAKMIVHLAGQVLIIQAHRGGEGPGISADRPQGQHAWRPAIGGGQNDFRRLVLAQALQRGRYFQRLAAIDRGIARTYFSNPDARRTLDRLPRRHHPRGTLERILRREQFVRRGHGDQPGEPVAGDNQRSMVHRRSLGQRGDLFGRLAPQAGEDHRPHRLRATTQQQQVQQAVLQRRCRLLDNAGSIQRIHLADHDRNEPHSQEGGDAQEQHDQSSESQRGGKTDHPVVHQRQQEQIGHDASGQADQPRGHVDRLDRPLRTLDARLDLLLVLRIQPRQFRFGRRLDRLGHGQLVLR